MPRVSIAADHPAVRAAETAVAKRTASLLALRGRRTVDSFHRELGRILWEHCGMARSQASLTTALAKIPALRQEFWQDAIVPGSGEELNQSLERAGRVADFLELGELICLDALERRESCGAHFREEHQDEEGESRRDDARFCHVAAWEYLGEGRTPRRHEEPLVFERASLTTRSYK
jgi:succinate dehydrogenase / fumarate reductase flavoprotein subunit